MNRYMCKYCKNKNVNTIEYVNKMTNEIQYYCPICGKWQDY